MALWINTSLLAMTLPLVALTVTEPIPLGVNSPLDELMLPVPDTMLHVTVAAIGCTVWS
jgi:hypothetical protein